MISAWSTSHCVSAVTGRASARRGFIKDDRPARHLSGGRVAEPAAHIAVSSLEFEGRLGVVIKRGGRPLPCLVAPAAFGRLRVCGELAVVNIAVARRTLPGSGFIDNAADAVRQDAGLMALLASYLQMRALEFKSRLAVVIENGRSPARHQVASAAIRCLPID